MNPVSQVNSSTQPMYSPSDKPLKVLFGFEESANKFVEKMQGWRVNTAESRVIGIEGEWGSGKCIIAGVVTRLVTFAQYTSFQY
jgi:hypothetical protein